MRRGYKRSDFRLSWKLFSPRPGFLSSRSSADRINLSEKWGSEVSTAAKQMNPGLSGPGIWEDLWVRCLGQEFGESFPGWFPPGSSTTLPSATVLGLDRGLETSAQDGPLTWLWLKPQLVSSSPGRFGWQPAPLRGGDTKGGNSQ